MNKTILTYGLIAGLIIITINTASLEVGMGQIWLGYLVMFIAFSSIFFAVRQYRDDTLGGVITFTTALKIGLAISAVASIVYVTVWEGYLAATNYTFIDSYVESIISQKKQSGASDAELARAISETQQMKVQYSNPIFRLPMTFLEVFPPGLLVSIVSAAALKNHKH